MRFYRLHFKTEGGNSDGYGWYTSGREAWKQKRLQDRYAGSELDHCDDPEMVDIVPSKDGILAALREFASHADNG